MAESASTKHIIFLVHGMGKHEDKWSEKPEKTLTSAYDALKPEGTEFADYFEVCEITYDHIIDEWRQQNANNMDAAFKVLGDQGASSSFLSSLRKMGDATTSDTFFNTHIIDVVFYRYINQFQELIRLEVAKQIVAKLDKSSQVVKREWSIVGHSLGSIVVHDTLQRMFGGTSFGEVGVDRLNPGDLGPKVCLMVANVSHVLSNDFDVYNSIVRPHTDPHQGAVEYYLSARHEIDPIASIFPFNPNITSWLDPATRSKPHERYQNLVLPWDDITNANIHSLSHYFKNPRLHVPFFRALIGDRDWIMDYEQDIAHEKYRGGVLAQELVKLKAKFEPLAKGNIAGLKGFLKACKAFGEILKDDYQVDLSVKGGE
ncbi:MAG: hypothetical protein HQL70_05255 [Magnetococcales bacterium]|nr:hypothetical protein [Magnetococcales bacterium]